MDLTTIVRFYDPLRRISAEKYDLIRDNTEDIVEEAIETRGDFYLAAKICILEQFPNK